MRWMEYHNKSLELMDAAQVFLKNGEIERAKKLFLEASEYEKRAYHELSPAQVRTKGITAVGVASLYFRAGNFIEAEKFIIKAMNDGISDYAKSELRAILYNVWSEFSRIKASIPFHEGQLLVSVSGGNIVEGGAPLNLIVEKVQTIQSLFYRTVELMREVPLRTRGQPTKIIQDMATPWLFQAAPGSYQFAVAVQGERQAELFGSAGDATSISQKFLEIVSSTLTGNEDIIAKHIPDKSYREPITKLVRNLAPDGKKEEAVNISQGGYNSVTIEYEDRVKITEFIKGRNENNSPMEKTLEINGILRAVHLDQDWIEVLADGKNIKIKGVSSEIDDIIGPMVNTSVKVTVNQINSERKLIDIEQIS